MGSWLDAFLPAFGLIALGAIVTVWLIRGEPILPALGFGAAAWLIFGALTDVAERIALAADHRPAHAGDRSDSRQSDSRWSDSHRSDSDEERGGGPAVVAVRPHLVWGPGDTQLVARIVARARAGRMPVIGTGAPLIDTVVDSVSRTLSGLSKGKRRDSEAVEKAVDRAVRSAVNEVWGKKPACHVQVVEV